jgi:hypothetical protein
VVTGGRVFVAPLLATEHGRRLIEPPLRLDCSHRLSPIGGHRLDGKNPPLCIDELDQSLVVVERKVLVQQDHPEALKRSVPVKDLA